MHIVCKIKNEKKSSTRYAKNEVVFPQKLVQITNFEYGYYPENRNGFVYFNSLNVTCAKKR